PCATWPTTSTGTRPSPSRKPAPPSCCTPPPLTTADAPRSTASPSSWTPPSTTRPTAAATTGPSATSAPWATKSSPSPPPTAPPSTRRTLTTAASPPIPGPDAHASSTERHPTMPITILDYVKSVVGDKDLYTAEDCLASGVDILGGCQGCHATIAVYNAYPSKSGYW